MAPRHIATRSILDQLSELRSYPNEELAPYEEFSAGGWIYFFTPGGSLYRKDPQNEEVDEIFALGTPLI